MVMNWKSEDGSIVIVMDVHARDFYWSAMMGLYPIETIGSLGEETRKAFHRVVATVHHAKAAPHFPCRKHIREQ